MSEQSFEGIFNWDLITLHDVKKFKVKYCVQSEKVCLGTKVFLIGKTVLPPSNQLVNLFCQFAFGFLSLKLFICASANVNFAITFLCYLRAFTIHTFNRTILHRMHLREAKKSGFSITKNSNRKWEAK